MKAAESRESNENIQIQHCEDCVYYDQCVERDSSKCDRYEYAYNLNFEH